MLSLEDREESGGEVEPLHLLADCVCDQRNAFCYVYKIVGIVVCKILVLVSDVAMCLRFDLNFVQ